GATPPRATRARPPSRPPRARIPLLPGRAARGPEARDHLRRSRPSGLSLLSKYGPEAKLADALNRNGSGDQRPGQRGSGESAEEAPRRCEMVGRRVEHMLQPRDEHLREQPPEQDSERERGCEHER